MRLIDADKLFRDIPLKVCVPCPFGEEKECKDCVIDKVIKAIDDAPTVEPVSTWHRTDEPPKEDGWYMLCFLSRWRDGNWWIPKFPDYWMPIEPPKEEADEP